MTDKEKRIQELIDTLSGSCEPMATHCEDLGLSDLDIEVTTMVDSQIFECTQCGWWCRIDEESSADAGLDEWTCADCVGGMT